MKLDVRLGDNGTTLELVDLIERRKVRLRFPSSVAMRPAQRESFVYPIDRAVTVSTPSVTVEPSGATTVLEPSGEVRTQVGTGTESVEIPPGEYYLDVSSHVKTYLRVESAASISIDVRVDHDPPAVDIDFGGEQAVHVGGRSLHEHPEATITTSPDPTDLMTAVSKLGSALKDLGPSRSFPSLRGHPPEIQLGDELQVPDALERPATGVTIETPAAFEYVFPIVSLAYYLGASIVPGPRPRLVTNAGRDYSLVGSGGFERTVERVLKQVFTCDCYVRAAGPISVPLARQEAFEEDTGITPSDVYDRPVAEQLATYLAVPFEKVEPYIPEWGVAAHLEPVPENIGHIPFLAKDLAVIRSPAVRRDHPARSSGGEKHSEAAAGSQQDTPSAVGPTARRKPTAIADENGGPAVVTADRASVDDSQLESNPDPAAGPDRTPQVVSPVPLEGQEQLWIADGRPIGADEPILDANRNVLDREPVDEIDIVVVCNDQRMDEEDNAVREVLGARTPFNVQVRSLQNLMTNQFRDVLKRGADVLYYIGHIEERGFVCCDGVLDARTLDDVNVETFFLNACQSHAQGKALIEGGAIAGVVTHEDITNSHAVRIGQSMARLLNNGFSFNSALRIASEHHGDGDQYMVLGEGSVQITQADNFPQLMHIDLDGGEAFNVSIRGFVSPQSPLGSVFAPNLTGTEGWYLTGDAASTRVTCDDLCAFLEHARMPVQLGASLQWSTDIAEQLSVVLEETDSLEEAADLVSKLPVLGTIHVGTDPMRSEGTTSPRLPT